MVLVKNMESSQRRYVDKRIGKVIIFGPNGEIELNSFSPNPGFKVIEKLPEKTKERKVKPKEKEITIEEDE